MLRLELFIIVIASLASIGSCGRFSSDPVHIPDAAFLEALQELGIDRDHDGIISTWEAEKVRKIELWPQGINDLTGIAAFINLDTLSIYLNPLDSVSLAGNPSLRYLELIGCGLRSLELPPGSALNYLDCSGSELKPGFLTRLDISSCEDLLILKCEFNLLGLLDLRQNIHLRELHCSKNSLTGLDLGKNHGLRKLSCKNNLMTSLDVSELDQLESLFTCGNQLTSLDISKNNHLTRIGIDNMIMLSEVCVWTLPFPPAGVHVISGFSPNISYTLDCKH